MPSGAETIQELKAAILAIEWEITDQAMDSLLAATAPLKQKWAGRKPLLVCLQVIDTLGLYIKRARERAHPEAIKLLHAVFGALETVVTDAAMSDSRKVALVRQQVDNYNKLKGELARSGRTAERKPPPTPPAKPREQPAPAGRGAGGGGGQSPIIDLLEQKEDQAVDGAFGAIFHEMVSDGRETPGAGVPAPPLMPSAGQGPDAKEVVLARVDNEEFPEADSLLDDFFSDDGLGFGLQDAAKTTPTSSETVAVDLGLIEPRKEATPAAPRPRPAEQPAADEIAVDRLTAIIEKAGQGVTAAVAAELATEIDRLSRQYPDRYSLALFLAVIGSVGRHLASHGEIAPELSQKTLQRAHERLSHSLFTLQPQKNLLASHLETIGDFIKWHEQVVSELEQVAAAAVPAAGRAEGEQSGVSVEMTAMITDIVRREVAGLRRELLELIMAR